MKHLKKCINLILKTSKLCIFYYYFIVIINKLSSLNQSHIPHHQYDPRRRPFIDISNGDYSDLRHHLRQIKERDELNNIEAEKAEEMNFHDQLRHYKHQLLPRKKHKHTKTLHQHSKQVS